MTNPSQFSLPFASLLMFLFGCCYCYNQTKKKSKDNNHSQESSNLLFAKDRRLDSQYNSLDPNPNPATFPPQTAHITHQPGLGVSDPKISYPVTNCSTNNSHNSNSPSGGGLGNNFGMNHGMCSPNSQLISANHRIATQLQPFSQSLTIGVAAPDPVPNSSNFHNPNFQQTPALTNFEYHNFPTATANQIQHNPSYFPLQANRNQNYLNSRVNHVSIPNIPPEFNSSGNTNYNSGIQEFTINEKIG